MKLIKFISIATLLMIFISCSKDDNNNNGGLSISFDTIDYKTAFYQSGETEILTVTSTSDLGEPVIALAEGSDANNSISYNPLTGRVEWTIDTPLGINEVTVVATAGSQEATVDITIENEFQGAFFGGYNFDPASTALTSLNYDLVFNSDGDLTVDDDGNPGSGTWSRDGNQITFTLSYDADPGTFFTYQGNLVNNGIDIPHISGSWYNGEEAEGVEQGYFSLDF